MTLVRIAAPTVLPVTTAEARAQLRVTHFDDDAYIASLIAAAVAHIDGAGVLGRAMISQTWANWFPASPQRARLGMGPFIALTGVSYYDADGALQAANLSDFETRLIDGAVFCLPKDGFSWPTAQSRPDAIRVSYTAGYGTAAADVPASLRHAILLLVAHWYDARAAASNTAMHDVPLAFDALIGGERATWYG